PPAAAGHLRRVLGDHHRDEPGRRPRLPIPRSPCQEGVMSANTPAEAAPGSPDRDPRDAGAAIDGAKLVRERRRNNAKRKWALARAGAAALAGPPAPLLSDAIALAAPRSAPATMVDRTQPLEARRYAPPSRGQPLGTDGLGRERWVRILWGARVSILVGVAATGMSMVIGTIMGLAAGHFSGLFGGIIMRIIDFFIVLPSLLLAIVLSSVLERGV